MQCPPVVARGPPLPCIKPGNLWGTSHSQPWQPQWWRHRPPTRYRRPAPPLSSLWSPTARRPCRLRIRWYRVILASWTLAVGLIWVIGEIRVAMATAAAMMVAYVTANRIYKSPKVATDSRHRHRSPVVASDKLFEVGLGMHTAMWTHILLSHFPLDYFSLKVSESFLQKSNIMWGIIHEYNNCWDLMNYVLITMLSLVLLACNLGTQRRIQEFSIGGRFCRILH